jgi:hypothetical protein
MYTVTRLGSGWYDFSKVPQNGYIKIHGLRCLTDRKAVDVLKRITSEKKPEFEIVGANCG